EIALLMADPSPELRTGTDLISAVVSGATMIIRPTPKMIEPGRKSMKYEAGGRYVLGLSGISLHGVLLAGTRANHSTPTAMIRGPAAMKIRGPYLAAKLPNRLEKKIRNRLPGIPAAPAAAAAFGTIYGQQRAWRDPIGFIALAVGVVATIALPLWMMRAKHPLIPLDLFRSRNFTVTNISTLLIYGALYVTFYYVGLFQQGTLGYAAAAAGAA